MNRTRMPGRGIFSLLALLLTQFPNNCIAAQQPGVPGMQVAELRCEMQTEPLNVQTTSPRLGWVLNSPQRGQRQIAWQVLAATRPEMLEVGEADLWDSGRQESSQSIHLAYRGAPLRSNQTVHWTARVWDANGAATAWAKPSLFRTAILNQQDWKAQWIGATPAANALPIPIEIAHWIWATEDTSPPKGLLPVPAGEMRLFRKVIALQHGSMPITAVLSMSADNEGKAWVNGHLIGETDSWEQIRRYRMESHLKEGRNVVLIAAKNVGEGTNPAGLLAMVSLFREMQEPEHLPTNASWIASGPATEEDLRNPALLRKDPVGASDNRPAHVLGAAGMKPWQHAVLAEDAGPRPIFRKEFRTKAVPARAVVHVCGLGHHKLFVNGKQASENFLDPAWSFYPKTAFYSTYDITGLLNQGANAFGVMLGNGFYNTAGDRRVNYNHDKRQLTLLAQAHLEYDDGTSEVLSTDDTWLWRNGPYTHTSILGGVDYDARQLPEDWASAGARAAGWSPVQTMNPDHAGELVAAIAPPMRTFEAFEPVTVDEPEPGIFVYDFGQNASATPSLRVRGASGATLRLTYSEQRHGATPAHNNGKGRADQSGIRSPNYLEYTLGGDGEEEWFPHLFYSGYQYIELTGAVPQGRPNPNNLPVVTGLQSVHVRSACPAVGTFACSNPMYERIDRMVDWSVRSNLAHVLTDCPHREKMGWLEVMHLMWPSIASRYDLSRFGQKVAKDIRDSQGPEGIIYTVAPAYATFPGPFQYTPEWGASGVLVPWYTYQWYGDDRVLSDNYDCMRGFVNYMHETAKDLVPVAGLGDWYDYGHGGELGASRFTPTELTAMATFGDCARAVSKTAAVLGHAADTRKYSALADQIAEAFNKRFAESEKEYKNTGSPQTANAIALVTGQVPAGRQKGMVDGIVADMEKRAWLQTAGDVGFHYLVRALADWGRSDAIFNMLAREELGSYQYLVNAGWTSLPESWDATRQYSMNHCMLGHIQEWFSQDVAGIKPDPESGGFKRFYLAPTVDGPITSAAATLQTPYGEISCQWSKDAAGLKLEATVPVNTEAVLRMPAGNWKSVEEGGRPVEGAAGIKPEQSGKRSGYVLGSGRYAFTFQ